MISFTIPENSPDYDFPNNHTPSDLPGQSDLSQIFGVDDTCTFWMDIFDLSGGEFGEELVYFL